MRDLENGSVINGATKRDISKTEASLPARQNERSRKRKRRNGAKKRRDLENGSVIIGATK